MKKIFVSYTYRDKNVNREFLRKVQIFLKKYSIPYIDIFYNKSLTPQYNILQRLSESDILLVINSGERAESKWVNTEIQLASILNKKILYITSDSFFEKEVLERIKRELAKQDK